jgi:PTH2 family peptidyl-tRNA hydrolase
MMEEPELRVKQVIVIRRDLKMRRGKEIAQGAHASIAWLTSRLVRSDGALGAITPADFSVAEWSWIQGNFRKICVTVNSEEELRGIVAKAKEAGLVAEEIEDTGLTEFHGEHTWTAAAIGPDYDDRIDPVTGHLPLY